MSHCKDLVWSDECSTSQVSLLTTIDVPVIERLNFHFYFLHLVSLSPEYDTHVWELPWLGLIISPCEALVCASEGENSRGIPPTLAVVLTVKWVSIDWLKKDKIKTAHSIKD